MTKFASIILMLALMLMSMAAPAKANGPSAGNTAPAQKSSQPQPAVQLDKIAKLPALKVSIADLLDAETGGVHHYWFVQGDALLTVDMKEAKTVSSDPQTRKAVIRLPKPVVDQPRVDHAKTRACEIRNGTLVFGASVENNLRDQAMLQAQKLVEQAANSPTNIQLARDAAAQIVQSIYKMAGWEVTIVWADQQTPQPSKSGVDP